MKQTGLRTLGAVAVLLFATGLCAQSAAPAYSSSLDNASAPPARPAQVEPFALADPGPPPDITRSPESPVTAVDRLAENLRSITLDMHLNADTGAVTTRARVRVRNQAASALPIISLQVSSALTWQSARLLGEHGTGTTLDIHQYHLTTDADHTGAVSELALTLPKPLAPGAEAELDLFYGGTLQASDERLLRLGAPAERAAAADWDGVSPEFVGLRGFGNVLWFPVAAPPTLLADGDRFARAVEDQRAATAATEMKLSLLVEHTGTALTTAWFLDRAVPLESTLKRRDRADAGATAAGDTTAESAAIAADPEQSQTETARWEAVRLDGRPVTLFIGAAPVATGPLRLAGLDEASRDSYTAAAKRVEPLLERWLPSAAASPLTVLALPAPAAQPFADGALLAVPPRTDDPAALAEALVYPMAAAAVPPDAPAWLREGLPEFLRLLYLEENGGRDRLLAQLGAAAPALQAAEAARGMDPAPLRTCVGTACARTKAAFALLMLRGIAGEAPLQQALAAALATTADEATMRGRSRAFQAALTQTSGKDLGWFFHDWFEADRGLPDLQIVQVAPRRVERGSATVVTPRKVRPTGSPVGAEPEAAEDDPRRVAPTAASRGAAGLPEGSWLVAVEVQNNGDVAAEVPVTVRSENLQNTLPLRVPAHSRATIRVPFETAPEEVYVNDGTTPEQRAGTHHRSISVEGAR